jgi:cell wall-associated NlpC family hydrolase
MGKHSKQKTRTSNRKKILATGAITIGLLASQTSAYAAVEKPQTETVHSETIQRVVEKSGIVESKNLNTAAIIAPVTASKDATVSFEKTVVTSSPSPERIAEENRVKAQAAAQVEAEKQAVIDAEATKVAQAEAAKVAQAKATQYTAQSTATGTGSGTATGNTGASSNAPVSGRQAAILAAARAQLGVAQDCTMLVTNSLKAVGINFHDWPAGYLKLGPVTTNPQPGDLIYYASGSPGGPAHIAVYAGNGKAVHGGFNGNSTVEFSVNVGSGPVYISMA